MDMKYSILLIIVVFGLISCKSKNELPKKLKKSTQVNFVPSYEPGPHVFVYKTSSNYNDKVPIMLSKDRKTIVSYPAPSDVIVGDTYRKPTLLKNEYLLDNIGIGENVAFIKLNYDEYSKLTSSPSIEELFSFIIDDKPLLELYDCGLKSAFTDEVNQLNMIIKANKLETTFKRVL